MNYCPENLKFLFEEHQKILAGESNSELRDYYELLWNLGGSQIDMASLEEYEQGIVPLANASRREVAGDQQAASV